MTVLAILLGLFCLSMVPLRIHSAFTFDNVRCIAIDKTILDFDYCHIKSYNRTYKYLSVKTKKPYISITAATVTLSILRRENRSVLYNFHVKFDGCKFMRDRDNAIVNWMFGSISDFTNMNHTCPYNEDILLEKLPVHHVGQWMRLVLPEGRYYFNSSWILNDEVNYQRYKADRAEQTHNYWVETLSWYPKEQARNYIRIDQIHHESRQQYGDRHFARYAAQRRLNQRFCHSVVDERVRETLYKSFGQERFDDYKVPATTNGVYGSVKPSKLHFC